jgi:hypothetical protein
MRAEGITLIHRLRVFGVLAAVVVLAGGCGQFFSTTPQTEDEIDWLTDEAALATSLRPTGQVLTSCGLTALSDSQSESALQQALNDPQVQSLRRLPSYLMAPRQPRQASSESS